MSQVIARDKSGRNGFKERPKLGSQNSPQKRHTDCPVGTVRPLSLGEGNQKSSAGVLKALRHCVASLWSSRAVENISRGESCAG